MYIIIQKADKDSNPDEVAVKRTKELALLQIEEISRQPTENQKAAKRTEFGMKENKNPIFTLSVDPFRYVSIYLHNCTLITSFEIPTCRSTPVETLHTILLGPYKYLLNWKRLQGMGTDGSFCHWKLPFRSPKAGVAGSITGIYCMHYYTNLFTM